jgi:hypothetical protein
MTVDFAIRSTDYGLAVFNSGASPFKFSINQSRVRKKIGAIEYRSVKGMIQLCIIDDAQGERGTAD